MMILNSSSRICSPLPCDRYRVFCFRAQIRRAAPEVSVEVDAAKVIHVMRGGMGASFMPSRSRCRSRPAATSNSAALSATAAAVGALSARRG